MPILHDQPAKQVGHAVWECSFEFKKLRLHGVSSVQIAFIFMDPSY